MKILIALLLFSSTALAQEKPRPSGAASVELGGNGFGLSINIEKWRHLISGNKQFFRIGLGTFPIPDSSTYTLFPVLAGYLHQLQPKAQLEYAAGVTFFYEKENAFGYDLTGSLAYRHTIGAKQAWFYKAAITPFLTLSDKKYTFYPYAGFSVGRLF